MKKVIQVTLSGHPTQFLLDQAADDALQSYLDRAKSRLENDPDREEVLRDLEQSIAQRLARLPDAPTRVVRREEMESTLEEVGAVDIGSADAVVSQPRSGQRRRFYRIAQGQWLAGVCAGLAAYSSIRVSRVRLIVVIASMFVAFLAMVSMFSSVVLGVFLAALPLGIYLALAFTVPVVRSPGEYIANHSGTSNAR